MPAAAQPPQPQQIVQLPQPQQIFQQPSQPQPIFQQPSQPEQIFQQASQPEQMVQPQAAPHQGSAQGDRYAVVPDSQQQGYQKPPRKGLSQYVEL